MFLSDLPAITDHDHQQHGHAANQHDHCGDDGDSRQRGWFWIIGEVRSELKRVSCMLKAFPSVLQIPGPT